jgi:hypothetical protein
MCIRDSVGSEMCIRDSHEALLSFMHLRRAQASGGRIGTTHQA